MAAFPIEYMEIQFYGDLRTEIDAYGLNSTTPADLIAQHSGYTLYLDDNYSILLSDYSTWEDVDNGYIDWNTLSSYDKALLNIYAKINNTISLVSFKRGDSTTFPETISEGTIYFIKDQKKLYIDIDSERHEIGSSTILASLSTGTRTQTSLPIVGKAIDDTELFTYKIPAATSTDAGLLTASTQTIAGSKTFTSSITLKSESSSSSSLYFRSSNSAYASYVYMYGSSLSSTSPRITFCGQGKSSSGSTTSGSCYIIPTSGYFSGYASSASTFKNAKLVTLTGDVTGADSSTGGWTIVTTLADSGVTADSYGPSADASPTYSGTFNVPYFTVDSKGRITEASTKTITLPANSIMGAATASTAGTTGLVPAPAAGEDKCFLRGDGTWGSNFIPYYNSNTAMTSTEVVDTGSYIHTVEATGGSLTTMIKPSDINNAWGVMHLHVHSGNYAMQLGFGCTTGNLYQRHANASATFGDWKTILDSGNYTSYTVKKDGTGASGSNWGISITGSSASCTGNAASASKIAVTDTTPTTGTTYFPLYVTGRSGNQTVRANEHFYYYDAGTESYICVGNTNQMGGITLRQSNGHYVNIIPGSLTAVRAIYLPDVTGTLLTTGNLSYTDGSSNAGTIGTLKIHSSSYTLKERMLNGTGKSLSEASITDLNTIKTPSVYYSAASSVSKTLTNAPWTSSGFRLITFAGYGGDSSYGLQVAAASSMLFWRNMGGSNADPSPWYVVPQIPYTGEGVGSATLPIYMNSNGKMMACSSTLGVSITGTAAKATADANGATISSTYLKRSGGVMTGLIEMKPNGSSVEGGEIHLCASASANAVNGIVIDNYNGAFRIFGIPSADGTTRTGTGVALAVDPYAKTISGSYKLTLITNQYNYHTDTSSYCLNCGNSDIVQVNGIYFADACEGMTEGIHFYRNGSTWDSISANGGTFYFASGHGSSASSLIGDATIRAGKVYGAVWNDYAEYRKTTTEIEPGRVVIENGDDTLSLCQERLMATAQVVSDTFGFAIGETDNCKTPLAVSGRVLVYTDMPRETFQAGDTVCSGINGTVSKMTREEIMMYPERIIGVVSAIPEYETWGTGDVQVNGRIWIKLT